MNFCKKKQKTNKQPHIDIFFFDCACAFLLMTGLMVSNETDKKAKKLIIKEKLTD